MTEISASEFARFQAGEREAIDELSNAFIDKSWYDFHLVFKTFGHPLSLAIEGDCHPPESECPPGLDRWLDGTAPSDFYFACVSPGLVKQIAAQLRKISKESFSEFDAAPPEDDPEWRPYFDAHAFEELKDAYATAAGHGNALMIMIC